MVRNRLKKALCLVLAVAMVFSLSLTASAADKTPTGISNLFSTVQSAVMKCVLSQKNFITKEIVRSQFRTAAAGGAALGCTTAANFLNHSLQNHPSALVYAPSSQYAVQLLKSEEGKQIIKDFKAQSAGESSYTMSGDIALDSTPDLYLAYNKVSYTASGTKAGDTWVLTITFKDRYDFAAGNWSSTLNAQSIVTVINNYAVYAQTLDAIVNYDISVTARISYKA